MFKFDNVSIQMRGGYRSLKNLNLEIPEGSFTIVVGGSGAGKSSLINAGAGLIDCSSGEVIFAGTSIAKMSKPAYESFLQRTAVVRQNPTLLNRMNVYENVALPLRLEGKTNREIRGGVLKSLETVGLLHKELSSVAGLTFGQQQKVNMARCLVKNPVAVLADDPTLNLDVKDAEDIMSSIYELRRRGATVLLAMNSTKITKYEDATMLTLWRGEIVR